MQELLKCMLDYVELIVDKRVTDDEPEPEAIPENMRSDLRRPGHAADPAAPSAAEESAAQQLRAGERGSEPAQSDTAANSLAIAAATSARSNLSAGASEDIGAPSSDYLVSFCCGALATVLGTLPVEQTDHLLAVLPALCAWALQDPDTGASGLCSGGPGPEQRVRAVAALIPAFHLTACQQVTGTSAASPDKWRTALQQPATAAAVAAALHLLCCKLAPHAPHDSSQVSSTIWRDAADSHMQQACEVFVVSAAKPHDGNVSMASSLQSRETNASQQQSEQLQSSCTPPSLAAQGLCTLLAALKQRCETSVADPPSAARVVLGVGQALAACLTVRSAATDRDVLTGALECLRFAVARQLAIGPDGEAAAHEVFSIEPRWWPVGPATDLLRSDVAAITDAERDRVLEGTLRLCGSVAPRYRAAGATQDSWLGWHGSNDVLSRVLRRLDGTAETLPIACMLADMAGLEV